MLECPHCGYHVANPSLCTDGRVHCPECGERDFPVEPLNHRDTRRAIARMCWPVWACVAAAGFVRGASWLAREVGGADLRPVAALALLGLLGFAAVGAFFFPISRVGSIRRIARWRRHRARLSVVVLASMLVNVAGCALIVLSVASLIS